MSEERWEIPQTWSWASVGEIADVVGGGTPPTGDENNFAGEGIAWLTPADLTGYSETYIARGRRDLSERGYRVSAARIMPAGTVLFSSRAPIGYCAVASGEITTNQGFKSFVLKGGIRPEYLRHYLLASVDYAESKASGTTFKELSGSRAAEIAAPIAPLPEQQRIVTKIDSVISKTKRARDHLNHIPRLVAKYKQAVLAAAFRGDLTKEWRTEGGGEPSEASSNRITLRSSANTGTRVQKTGDVTPDQIAGMWSAPAHWHWRQVGDCAFVTKLAGFEYTKHVKYSPNGDLRVIKAENAGPEGFRETDYSRVASDAVGGLTRSRLLGGELLVVFVGAGTGNVAVVPEADDFFLGPNIAMARPFTDVAISRYLELFFRSSKGRELLLMTSKAVAQPSLSMGAIRSTPVLLPCVAEQVEIVRRVDAALIWIDRLASDATSARKLIDHLDQAVLAKAFRGELVPQDPTDEPASVLLDRIRAERGTTTKAGRGRKATTT
ncbi:restriction endonuclease subunit S [Ensifer sp. P24N7]|uniref:restriction endonuclease subunit S n=1 Tax=Sinorhizobium sp. P24N7 TaxID=3348358 RepID=UPI0035F3EC6F